MNKKGFLRSGFLFVLLLITGLGATAVLIPIVRADTITVTTTDDEVNNDGDCSLREAVLAANSDTAVDACPAGSGDDVITLPPGTYMLTLAGAGEDAAQTGDLDITANLTINGAGQSSTVIDGNGADRIFDVQSVAQISGVTLQNGNAPAGAGIHVAFNGQLTLSSSRVTGSTATAGGGGILASGALTMTHSRVDGNSGGGGGGILVSFGPALITHSEISGNNSSAAGGGIYSSGILTLVNSTLSGNNANSDGGGLFVVESQNNKLYNVTISANTADADGDGVGDGGGVRLLGGLSLANSLIGGNTDSGGNNHPDCSGALNSQGYNLVANVTGCTINGDATGNLLGVDPLLGPLQNNGGSTFTQALLGGSPAINTANPGGCRDQDSVLLTTDQRGFTRPDSGGALCDIGAYEAGSDDAPTPTPTATAVATATPTAEYWQYLPLIQK